MSTRSDKYLNFMTTMAVLVAVVAVAARIRPGIFGQSPPLGAAGAPPRKPVPVENWESYAKVGHRIGPENASVTILEFGDFECPACQYFATHSWAGIHDKYPNDVALIFRHWPLSIHKFSYAAARAAECAGNQGRFEEMHDRLFKKQDSLGLKPFEEFARESGVKDLKAFEACSHAKGPVPAVDTDSGAARSLGGMGTPTIVINGIRYMGGGPDSTKLDSIVRAGIHKN